MSITKKRGKEKITKLDRKISLSKKFKKKSKKINHNSLTKNKLILPITLLIVVITLLFFIKPDFIGYFALENTSSYIQQIDEVFVENSSYLLHLEKGNLKSLKVSGQLIGEGKARIYLEAGSKSYLIFDSTALEKKGLVDITGFAVDKVNKTEKQKKKINETADLNETTAVNESLNETEQLNKTTQTNETIDKTINPPEDAEILIELEYNDGPEFDVDNNGIEERDGIIDFNVNSNFNWAVNKSNLCTLWDIYSIDDESAVKVCYGSEKCCNFVGLEPLTSNWNEVFYSYYSRYGATANNKISAQVVYVDYSISEEKPYSYVYYSELAGLNAMFLEEEKKIIQFNNICKESCLLSLDEDTYWLRIEVENATLKLENISYTMIPLEVEIINSAPVLLKNISDILISKGGSISIDLNEYFYDLNNDSLQYEVYSMENISAQVDGSIITLVPDKEFIGTRNSFVIANDSKQIAVSNVFKVDVTNILINYSSLKQKKIKFNEPVEWTQVVFITNPTTSAIYDYPLALSLPEDAFDVQIVGNNILSADSLSVLISKINSNKTITLTIRFKTSPVKVKIFDKKDDLISLIPQKTFNIKIFENNKLLHQVSNMSLLEKLNLSIPTTSKQVVVFHDSPLHYHNVPIEVEIETEDVNLFEEVKGTEKPVKFEVSKGKIKWNVSDPFNKTYLIKPKKFERIQEKAEVGKPVNWALYFENITINYQTPSPVKEDTEIEYNDLSTGIGYGKKIVISHSNDDTHYQNV